MSDTEKRTIGYAWNWSVDLGSGRMVGITGNFPIDYSADQMNAEMDKIRTVLERQQAKTAIPAVEAEIEQMLRTVEGATSDLQQLDGTSQGKTLSTAERQSREALISNVRRHQSNLTSKQKFLEQLRKEAA